MSTYPDTRAGALQCLTDNAVPEVVQAAEQAVEAGTHVWTPDPEVQGVWGLVLAGTLTADIVVYCTDADFTVSDDFEERAL